MILSDLDIVNSVHRDWVEPYETALKFSNALPDYSLLQYRDLAFLLCHFFADQSEFQFETSSLHGMINELHEAQLIHTPQKDSLHQLRMLGNHGAHKEEQNFSPKQTEKSPSRQVDEKRLNTLREESIQAREIFLDLVCDLYRLIYPNKKLPDFESSPTGEQDHKEMLFAAIKEPENWQAQYEAGLTYEMLAERLIAESSVLQSVSAKVHWVSLLTKAAASYKAAWMQSAIQTQLDPQRAFADRKNPEAHMAQVCKLEPLYKFCWLRTILTGVERENDPPQWTDKIKKEWKLLLKAADRNHPEANTLVGEHYLSGLPGNKPELKNAAKYLNRAHQLGANDAYLPLYEYYMDPESVDHNIDTALELLREGADSDCTHCQRELGDLYYDGEYLDKDDTKAKYWLQQAADRGHHRAAFALELYFGDLVDNMQQQMLEVLEGLNTPSEPIVKPPKIGRNDPCPCNSGYKYKKCCGSAAPRGVIPQTMQP